MEYQLIFVYWYNCKRSGSGQSVKNMTSYDKIKWVLGIVLVFGLIITTNLIDKNNFIRVRDSVVTIYEDRLIANDLIYKMSNAIQEKQLALAVSDSTFFQQQNASVNARLQRHISRYEETKLTPEEGRVFAALKENLQALAQAESAWGRSDLKGETEISNQIREIRGNLDDLSEIQLNEGSRQMSISKRAVDKVELFTQIEVYVLVILAILIQIIVMYKPRAKP